MLCFNCCYSLTLKTKLICSLFSSRQLTFLSLLPFPITIPLNPFNLHLFSPFKIPFPTLFCLVSVSHLSHFFKTAASSFLSPLPCFSSSHFSLFPPCILGFHHPLFSVPFFPVIFLPLVLLVLPGSFLHLNESFSISLLLSVIFLFVSPLMR